MVDRVLGGDRHSTVEVSDDGDGHAGVELHRETDGQTRCVARVLFWDAAGQFLMESCETDVPLTVAEELTRRGPAGQLQLVRRCLQCHSAQPTDDTFRTPPNGITFENPASVQALAPRIRFRAVDSETMPLANKTGMTPEERRTLGRWIAQGARTE